MFYYFLKQMGWVLISLVFLNSNYVEKSIFGPPVIEVWKSFDSGKILCIAVFFLSEFYILLD